MKLFSTLFKSLKPTEYDEISETKLKHTSLYFLKVVSIAFVLMCILTIPFLIEFNDTIQSQMNGFDKFVLNVDYTQTKPITLGTPPWVTIDLQSNTSIPAQGILVTEQTIALKKLFFEKVVNLEGYSNITEHKKEYAITLFTLFLLMLPSILIIAFVWYLVKFALLILALSLITLIIVRVSRYEISYQIILNSAIFAATIAIFFELLTVPFNIIIPYIPVEIIGYLLTILFFSIAIIEQGYWDKKQGLKPKKKGYLEYGE